MWSSISTWCEFLPCQSYGWVLHHHVLHFHPFFWVPCFISVNSPPSTISVFLSVFLSFSYPQKVFFVCGKPNSPTVLTCCLLSFGCCFVIVLPRRSNIPSHPLTIFFSFITTEALFVTTEKQYFSQLFSAQVCEETSVFKMCIVFAWFLTALPWCKRDRQVKQKESFSFSSQAATGFCHCHWSLLLKLKPAWVMSSELLQY